MRRQKLRYSLTAGTSPPDPPMDARFQPVAEDPVPRPPGQRILTVAELTRGVRRILESSYPDIWVRGEVCGLSRPQSGHVYFNLHDGERPGEAQISVVVWREDTLRLRVGLEDGLRVVLRGRLTVYEKRGSYQLVASSVEAEGQGAAAAAFERLKVRLAAEGLFAQDRKRLLPFFPSCVGLITSPSGAAIHDILKSIFRRHPGASVRFVPVRVQGEGAAGEICRALEFFQRPESGVEVLILGRGGGAPEDLAAFNDEALVRAVAACRIPTISAIGHEVDFTLCDFAADVRAQTPTHAGELVVPDTIALRAEVVELGARLERTLSQRLGRLQERLDHRASSSVLRKPEEMIRLRARQLDDLGLMLQKTLYNQYLRWHHETRILGEKLEALSPLGVLKRGYAVVFHGDGRVVRKASELKLCEEVTIRWADGLAAAKIGKLEEPHGG